MFEREKENDKGEKENERGDRGQKKDRGRERKRDAIANNSEDASRKTN